MRPLVLLAIALVSSSSWAQAVVAVLDAQNVRDETPKKAQRAAEAALRAASSLSVGEGPGFRKGAPRKCADDCARDLVKNLSPVVLLLDLKGADAKGDRVTIDAQLWFEGEKVGLKRGEGAADALDATLRPLVDSLLPGWMKKGFGGLVMPDVPGSVVKLDGRVLRSRDGDVSAVSAGSHTVDVVFPDGNAVLQRVDVAEGRRTRFEPKAPVAAITAQPRAGVTALRGFSYGIFMTGAASITAGFIAGGLARWSVADVLPCPVGSTNCTTLDMANERARQAGVVTTTGNVLLGVGLSLAAIGAGLFVIDVVTE